MTPYHQADSKPDNGMIATIIRDKLAEAERWRAKDPRKAQRLEEEAAALDARLKTAMKGVKHEPGTDS